MYLPLPFFAYTGGSDFISTLINVTFTPGQIEALVQIPILDDSVQEDTEMFIVMLSTIAPNVMFSKEIPTVTITDDDGKDMILFHPQYNYTYMQPVLAFIQRNIVTRPASM